MKECSTRSRYPLKCFSFWLLIPLSPSIAAAGTYNVTPTATNETGPNSGSSSISVGLLETIQAASPSLGDVKSDIARAKAGDTVLVPAGEATWNNQLVRTKGIRLIGAGAENTVITSGYAAPTLYDSTGYIVAYLPRSPKSNEPFRLSGFTFDLAGTCQWIYIRNERVKAIE